MSKTKELDIEISELQEKYGKQFADLITSEIENSLEMKLPHRIHILNDNRYFEILFVTPAYFQKYNVFPKSGSARASYVIGYHDAKVALEIMDELDKEKIEP